MKRIVLVFGLISGAILSVTMIMSAVYADQSGVHGYIIGYASMVVAFLLVNLGIRSYRDNVAGGALSFGRGFAVGICITILACLCYVASWEFVYHKFFPDFMDKYASYAIEKTRTSGATPAQIDAKVLEMTRAKEMYKNPFFRMAETFIEAFPVGLLFTLVSAGLLRRKRSGMGGAAPIVGTSPVAR